MLIKPDKIVYDGADKDLKIWVNGSLHYKCQASNNTVATNAWRYPDAGCPPGTYTLSAAETDDPGHEQTSMGPYFIPVNNIPGHTGIGLHGGGSCVIPHSMDPYQGWCPTENCIRLQNANLIHVVNSYVLEGVTFEVYQPPSPVVHGGL